MQSIPKSDKLVLHALWNIGLSSAENVKHSLTFVEPTLTLDEINVSLARLTENGCVSSAEENGVVKYRAVVDRCEYLGAYFRRLILDMCPSFTPEFLARCMASEHLLRRIEESQDTAKTSPKENGAQEASTNGW